VPLFSPARPSRTTPANVSPGTRCPTCAEDVNVIGASLVPTATSLPLRVEISAAGLLGSPLP
jgi:hypothetical protein